MTEQNTQTSPAVTYENRDGIGIITIDRPRELNALNSRVITELGACLDGIYDEPRCLVLRGGGTKAFVAGADIAEMQNFGMAEAKAFAELAHSVLKRIESFPAPVIAAVNGYALGGGTELALCADLRIASEKAVFALPETGLGVIPGFGGTWRLPRLIGIPRAKEMIYTGRRVKADEALRIGLVNAVYPADEFENGVLETAKLIASKAPAAVRAAKAAIDGEYTLAREEALCFETGLFAPCYETEDQKEGMTAFLEKRPAKPYQGK